MSTVIVYIGGTMDTEREVVNVAPGAITVPADGPAPQETYRRLDPTTEVPVRYGLVLAHQEGSRA